MMHNHHQPLEPPSIYGIAVNQLIDAKGQGIGGASLWMAPEARPSRDRYATTVSCCVCDL